MTSKKHVTKEEYPKKEEHLGTSQISASEWDPRGSMLDLTVPLKRAGS